MRQLLSTTLVACIVGALAGATVSTVAQAPAEPPVTTTALDADTVDGVSAVKATNKKAKRKNRLVATDTKGFLPSNIVKAKWGLIAGKPAFLADGLIDWNEVAAIPATLADGQVGWGEVAGIPAGFADSTDDEGVTGVKVKVVTSTTPVQILPGKKAYDLADCPPGFLAVGGGYVGASPINVYWSAAADPDTWGVWGHVPESWSLGYDLYAQVICLRAEPGGAMIAAKNSDFGPAKTKVRTPRK